MNEKTKPILIISESVHNADMYYATGLLAPDPFLYLRFPHREKDIVIVSQMEYERARKEASVKEIRSTLDYGHNIKREELITKVLQEEGIEGVEVPPYFPLYIAEELRKKGIEVVPVEELLMTKEREIKDELEIVSMRKAQRACEHA
ncbi:MAG: hypothetical protein KAT65_05185, partial [Methanophagales archaeon]|nr:hypothetical protein [Methanophagales archaeon]